MNEIEKAQQEITEARDKLASAEARLSALSKVEKEYRAGEWVPKLGSEYWLNDHDGTTFCSKNSNHRFDKYRIKSGNAFPRKPIAESRQIPDLKERVKELMRDAMDAAISYDCNYPWKTPDYEAFHALCAPEVNP